MNKYQTYIYYTSVNGGTNNMQCVHVLNGRDRLYLTCSLKNQAEKRAKRFINKLLKKEKIKVRLDYLRKEIEAERISYAEIAELQSLKEHIEPTDTVLLEWAGVPEQVANNTEKITIEMIKNWLGSDNAGNEAINILEQLLNKSYTVEELKKDIISYQK